jgi:type I restriction enzyme S subunit
LNDGVLRDTDEHITEAGLAACAAKMIEPGAVLVALYGATIGRASINAIRCATNQAVAYCVPHPGLSIAEYLFWYVIASRGALRDLGQGGAQPNISQAILKQFPVPLPPVAEQRRIVVRIEALFARTSRARADLQRIAPLSRRHRDRTLANAFDTGTPTPIADLACSIFDGPFGSNLKSNDYTDAGTRVVRLENIGHLRFIGDKATFITDEKAEGLRRHYLKPSDVLFSSFIDKEVRVCLFPPGQTTKAINKADCFSVRIDSQRADPLYVALRLASPVTYEDMRDAVHGATRPRIGITDLKRYVINVPSIAEQRTIADWIERQHGMSNAIQRDATRTLALLDRLEQSILARAFRGELVPQHANAESVADSPVVIEAPSRRRRRRAA